MGRHTAYERLICFVLILVLSAACIPLSGCSTALADPISVSGFKLNTYVEIKGYDTSSDKDILTRALALCDKYEQIFSRTLEDSELSQLNRHEITVVSAELGELIEYGIEYANLSEGSFDISIGAVSSLWDFTTADPSLPDSTDIENALRCIDYTQIDISKNNDGTYTVIIPEGMILDLGAVAKGYIADRIKDYLGAQGVKSALINLGGNVLCVGSRSNGPFSVRVRKPFAEASDYICTAKITDQSVVTSGTYERCFTIDGQLYHHILSPKTGYPYDNGLAQVTIISDDSVTGDCLSTACFTLGLEKGLALIEATDNAEAIFVTSDGTMHMSSNAAQYIEQ